jgi:hypothetical protein
LLQQVLFVIWTLGNMLTRLCRIEVSKVMQTVVLGWQQQLHWPTGCPHWLQNLAGCMMFIGCRMLFRADVTVMGLAIVVFIGAFCVVFCAFAADKTNVLASIDLINVLNSTAWRNERRGRHPLVGPDAWVPRRQMDKLSEIETGPAQARRYWGWPEASHAQFSQGTLKSGAGFQRLDGPRNSHPGFGNQV